MRHKHQWIKSTMGEMGWVCTYVDNEACTGGQARECGGTIAAHCDRATCDQGRCKRHIKKLGLKVMEMEK